MSGQVFALGVQSELVSILEMLLEEARAGRLVGFSGAAVTHDHEHIEATYVEPLRGNLYELMGAFRVAETRLLARVEGAFREGEL